MQQFTNTELMAMVRRLHKDNERDTVAGIRENEAEFIALKRIHERNNIIHMILQKVNL